MQADIGTPNIQKSSPGYVHNSSEETPRLAACMWAAVCNEIPRCGEKELTIGSRRRGKQHSQSGAACCLTLPQNAKGNLHGRRSASAGVCTAADKGKAPKASHGTWQGAEPQERKPRDTRGNATRPGRRCRAPARGRQASRGEARSAWPKAVQQRPPQPPGRGGGSGAEQGNSGWLSGAGAGPAASAVEQAPWCHGRSTTGPPNRTPRRFPACARAARTESRSPSR
mmetsp:Transcript_103854/g.322921  ORF Transcript_103854/g.322921 Transcript_103854/m.322921 type:complete len:226 (+) Transcript_103854:121-798(+)